MPKKPAKPKQELTELRKPPSSKFKRPQPDPSNIREFDSTMRGLIRVPKSDVDQKSN